MKIPRAFKDRGRGKAWTWNGTVALLVGLLVSAQVGCSHVPSKTLPAAAQAGRIAVVSAQFAPATDLQTPAKGGAAGVGRGAARGALKGMAFGAQLGQGCVSYACLVALALIPIGGIVGVLVGAAEGGVDAVPAAVVEGATTDLRRAISTLDLQALLRERIVEAGRTRTSQPLVVDGERGPRSRGETVDYRPLTNDGIDSVLEMSVLTLDLAGPWDVDPLLELKVSVRARLVRATDGVVTFERTVDQGGLQRRFTDWAANDAQIFLEESAAAIDRLALTIADDLFGPAPHVSEHAIEGATEADGLPSPL